LLLYRAFLANIPMLCESWCSILEVHPRIGTRQVHTAYARPATL
jgi:hypothetical protein